MQDSTFKGIGRKLNLLLVPSNLYTKTVPAVSELHAISSSLPRLKFSKDIKGCSFTKRVKGRTTIEDLKEMFVNLNLVHVPLNLYRLVTAHQISTVKVVG